MLSGKERGSIGEFQMRSSRGPVTARLCKQYGGFPFFGIVSYKFLEEYGHGVNLVQDSKSGEVYLSVGFGQYSPDLLGSFLGTQEVGACLYRVTSP